MDCSGQPIQIPTTAAVGPSIGRHQNIEHHRPFTYLESPFERLFPSGPSEPSQFTGPILGRLGIQYGTLESLGDRSDMARGRVDRVSQGWDTPHK